MCLGAILWSGIPRVVFAARREDAEAIGFDAGPVFPASVAYLRGRGIDRARPTAGGGGSGPAGLRRARRARLQRRLRDRGTGSPTTSVTLAYRRAVAAPRQLTLAATSLGSSIAFLDTTVVIVALPRMEEELDLGLSGQQWVVLGYALALSALFLVSGAIGDRVGLRRTFVTGVVLFAAASALCAAAGSESALVAGRVLQGVGGAALTTTSLALLRVTWAG
jgi:hypothetical protein